MMLKWHQNHHQVKEDCEMYCTDGCWVSLSLSLMQISVGVSSCFHYLSFLIIHTSQPLSPSAHTSSVYDFPYLSFFILFSCPILSHLCPLYPPSSINQPSPRPSHWLFKLVSEQLKQPSTITTHPAPTLPQMILLSRSTSGVTCYSEVHRSRSGQPSYFKLTEKSPHTLQSTTSSLPTPNQSTL